MTCSVDARKLLRDGWFAEDWYTDLCEMVEFERSRTLHIVVSVFLFYAIELAHDHLLIQNVSSSTLSRDPCNKRQKREQKKYTC